MSRLIYYVDRMLLAGAPVSRWLNILLLFVGALGALGLVPGHWLTAALCALLLAGFFWLRHHWRSRDYVQFQEATLPQITPQALAPSDKVPIHATGYFTVEGKNERFTWLQGYFRTFATREHAVICLVQPKLTLMAQWPEKDVGMWYVFFFPRSVRNVRYGTVTFGRKTQPCVAVEHEIHIPKKGRFSRERTLHETVILASDTEADALRMLADLLHDNHVEREEKEPPQPAPTPSPNGQVNVPIGATRRLD